LGHKWLIEPFVGDISFYPFVLLGIIYVIVNPIYLLYQNYLNTKQDGLAYGLNSIANTFLYIGLVVLFLVKFNMGVLGVLLAHLIVAVVFFIYVAVCFLRKLYLKWNSHTMKEAFKYSLPLLPHTLANWSNGTIDKLLVNDIRSTADTGIYGLGQQYAGVMSITANAINQAYVPWFYQKVDSNELHLVRHSANALVALVCILAVILTFFSKELLSLMISNPAYYDVYTIIPYLVFAFVFQFIYFFFVNILFLKDTGVIFVITALTVLFNVGLNLSLIPKYGIIGAAVACTVTYFLKSVFALIVSLYRNKVIRFNWAYMYLLAFGTFFMAIGFDWISKTLNWGNMLLIKIGSLIILCCALLYIFEKDIRLIMVQFKRK
jgi:O-antigen/teichoic acid export membrane protein